MDNAPIVVHVDLGPAAWALAVGGVLALGFVCVTCVILARSSRGRAAEVLSAFADVIRAFRRRPRHENPSIAKDHESARQPLAPAARPGLVRKASS